MASYESTPLSLIEIKDLKIEFPIENFVYGTLRESFVNFFHRKKSKPISQKAVVDIAHLKIQNKERVGILGQNGAGKSTLCRCLAGLLPQNKGTIQIRGKIKAIFENQICVQPELTARENADFVLSFLHPEIKKSERKLLLEDAFDFSGLKEFLDQPFKSLSYGMQTRLGLSVLSTVPSDILILDEVFQGADVGFQERISKRFQNLIEQSGAVLFVSHTEQDIERVCDRVLVLHNGLLVYDGDVRAGLKCYRELCHQPLSLEPTTPLSLST